MRYCHRINVVIAVVGLAAAVDPSLSASDLPEIPNSRPKWPRIESSIVSKVQRVAAKRVVGSEADPPAEIVVLLQPEPGALSGCIERDQLRALGARVLASSRHMLRVVVPYDRVQSLPEIRGVSFIREPRGPSPNAVVSEGVSFVGAVANHNRGVRGGGASVAMLDRGFVGANSTPAEIGTTRNINLTSQGMFASPTGWSASGARHGTACAEIVRDVAPDADLYLVKFNDFVDFENAVDTCIARGVDVLSFSGSWLDHGFGDGLGEACTIVNHAFDSGVVWVNAAGNYASRQYSGLAFDADANGWLDVGTGTERLYLQNVAVGDTISLFLTWDDWPSSTQDFDLYLYRVSSSGSTLSVVDSSVSEQSTRSPTPPYEYLAHAVLQSGRYFARVANYSSTRTPMVKVWSEQHDLDNSVASVIGTIGVPADARGAFAVGAIDQALWARPVIAPYSSQGPTVRNVVKPDIVAPSTVTTASYGRLGFAGTSAAAPHVAGAAALVKSANPLYTAQQVIDVLTRSAVDLGTPGKDNVFGYGKLALPTLTPVAVPRVTRITTTARYGDVVTIDGLGFGRTRGTGKVVFYYGVEPASTKYVTWSDTKISVRLPTGARTGNAKVVAATGESNGILLTVLSPYITSISPTTARSGQAVTVRGLNLGTTQGSSQIKLGAWSFDRVTRWGNTEVTAVVPANAYSNTVTIQTPDGMSNAVQLAITSPYLLSMTPLRGRNGDQITLTGGNFGATRGTAGAVMFGTLRPSVADYVSWSANRIVVKIPTSAASCEVKVVTAQGESGQRHLDVESGFVSIPADGPFGYSPPTVTSTPKGVVFEFERGTTDMILTYKIAEVTDSEVMIKLNSGVSISAGTNILPASYFWKIPYSSMVAGKNTIEFRNDQNQPRTTGFDTWVLRDVALWKPYQAKLAGALNTEEPYVQVMSTLLLAPFPVPSNAGVVIPYYVAVSGDAEITVVNTLGQEIASLVTGYLEAGSHTVAWDGRDRDGVRASSGIYIVVLRAGGALSTARLVLLK